MMEQLAQDELLLAHAAGRLPEPVALAVATHLALSPDARARYARYEALGGVLLDRLEPEAIATDGWERLAARLDEKEEEEIAPPPPKPPTDHGRLLLPRPLRDYVGEPLDRLKWRRYGPLAEAELKLGTPGYRTSLIRMRAGGMAPKHTHEGQEITVVIEGAFSDALGHYRRGDLVIADSRVDHRPKADEDRDCLCLAVADAPLRLTGRLGWLLNPFIRF
jgi:putative transcriptional regulator